MVVDIPIVIVAVGIIVDDAVVINGGLVVLYVVPVVIIPDPVVDIVVVVTICMRENITINSLIFLVITWRAKSKFCSISITFITGTKICLYSILSTNGM